ncbi:unnamed protein product, partial [Symbiodinium sp. CCMP2456]
MGREGILAYHKKQKQLNRVLVNASTFLPRRPLIPLLPEFFAALTSRPIQRQRACPSDGEVSAGLASLPHDALQHLLRGWMPELRGKANAWRCGRMFRRLSADRQKAVLAMSPIYVVK